MRILIAEDNDGCRKIMQRFLEPLGECTVCMDGAQAVAAVEKAFSENTPFDLICLDIHMPNMEGNQAAAGIRDLEARHGDTRSKIMIVTALGDPLHATSAFDADCDAFISKPFTHAGLIEQLFFMGLIDEPPSA